jgi:hypothetical protein
MTPGPFSNRSARRLPRLAAAVATGMLLAAAGPMGCTHQYANYPEIPSAKGLKQDPNTPAAESAMVTALQFVANRYPPGTLRLDAKNSREAGEMITSTPMVVNLPVGQRQSYYRRIARKVGPNVAPMTADVDASLPVFHVTRVWLRFSEGWVDVMRPMPELPPGPDGKPVYQTVTLKMRGGVGPWRVLHARAWPPGIDPVPQPFLLPDQERINQYEFSTRAGDDSRDQVREPELDAATPAPVQ